MKKRKRGRSFNLKALSNETYFFKASRELSFVSQTRQSLTSFASETKAKVWKLARLSKKKSNFLSSSLTFSSFVPFDRNFFDQPLLDAWFFNSAPTPRFLLVFKTEALMLQISFNFLYYPLSFFLKFLSETCHLRSRFWWFIKFCISHQLSHFAALFNQHETKSSVA